MLSYIGLAMIGSCSVSAPVGVVYAPDGEISAELTLNGRVEALVSFNVGVTHRLTAGHAGWRSRSAGPVRI